VFVPCVAYVAYTRTRIRVHSAYCVENAPLFSLEYQTWGLTVHTCIEGSVVIGDLQLSSAGTALVPDTPSVSPGLQLRGVATGVDIGIYTPKISPSRPKLFTG